MPNLISQDLIDFWFSDRVSKLWYSSTPEFDKEVNDKFSSMYNAACDGELDNWRATANGCLALIILFDQYPLNVFRGDKKSFATETQALEIAQYCIDQGLDQQLTKTQQSFVAMPFMHSEQIAHQELAIKLYNNISPNNLEFAHHHYDIIKKYGRFPHRNKILGRQSTPEEQAYLESKEAFTG
ncbi:FIG027190: Putative transmembrane protein [hydrothermal vent metagenome]|uniref:FIG027190: Putative transmembrane protein n=1 Tax=hydrothermal vent metagenome TaxID=652676 RepID=A0A3B0ZSS5_9ZZZZ